MFTTASWSGNSNRCGTRASRSFGPMSGSVLMIVNTLSITSRNSAAELKAAIAGRVYPGGARYSSRWSRLSCCCRSTSSIVSSGSRAWAWLTSAADGRSSAAGQVAGSHSFDRTNAFGQWA